MATVRLEIKGEAKAISLRTFIGVVQNSFGILQDLDLAISHHPEGTLDWLVSDLSTGSLVVQLDSVSRLSDKNFGPEVASAFITGFSRVENEGTSPPYLSEAGMRKVKQLLKLIGKDGAHGISVSDLSKQVDVTAKASANIDQLIPARRRSIGGVEGRLEMISIHRKPRFVVYHAVTRKGVTCRFDPEKLLEEVKDALGRRVIVSGTVHANAKNEPVRVDMERLRILRLEDELPSRSELSGSDPDFTDELTTEEFVEDIRVG